MDWITAVGTIKSAMPRDDHALFDSATRSAYERGFEAMRAIALASVCSASEADTRDDILRYRITLKNQKT